MKKIYFILLAALLFSLPTIANDVIVKGYVTYNNGTPALNQQVYISTDSLTTPMACYQGHVKYTNANGYYDDTLHCTGSIVKVRILVSNCNNGYLAETPQVNTATNIVEKNFTLSCNPTCVADFNFSVQQLSVGFNSTSTSSSSAGVSAFHWTFGDGTTGTGANVTHTYPAGGAYTVKLVIESANTCKDSITKTVVVYLTTGTCHADFRDSILGANKFYFISGNSTTASGDSITQRFWSFGDGTGTGGNQVNVDHIYQTSGTFTVCLKIVSGHGCIDSTCKTITATAPPTNCVAYFVYQTSNHAVSFNSSSSTGVTPTDAVVTRLWSFGDNTGSTSSNEISPTHTYAMAGTYQVCLHTVTASGCQSDICKIITIIDTACHANFNYTVGPNGYVQFSNTSNNLSNTVQFNWNFGNTGTSSDINPSRTFAAGTYNVCLRMYNASTGCRDSICKTVVVTITQPTKCEASYSYQGLPVSSTTAGFGVQFGSPNSHATSAVGDSIFERIWVWGDGSTTTGNVYYPIHTYVNAGTYNVCLVIRCTSGCSDTTCKSIVVPMPNQVSCNAQFTYENLPYTTPPNREVRFNSTTSSTSYGDSIISRKWTFGDGTTLTNNTPIISHNYITPGTYNVCLTIKTALNCEKTECKLIVVSQTSTACIPQFTWQRTPPKQINFNSSMSWVPVNDSIITRTWNFGDASAQLTGNVVSPSHTYLNFGIYTVSLRIKTAKNCEQTVYIPVTVQDSIVIPPTVEPIKIISIYPNPAIIQTQTVVWSQNNNVQAELAIYDVYGSKKWSTNKILLQGNNMTVIPTGFLAHGPYYFRVTTVYGVKTRPFFKN